MDVAAATDPSSMHRLELLRGQGEGLLSPWRYWQKDLLAPLLQKVQITSPQGHDGTKGTGVGVVSISQTSSRDKPLPSSPGQGEWAQLGRSRYHTIIRRVGCVEVRPHAAQ